MRVACFLLFTTGALMAADVPTKDAPSKGDLDKLQGTWLTVSLVNDGKTLVDEKSPPKEGPATKLVYDGKSLQSARGQADSARRQTSRTGDGVHVQ
jgi:hypothetical protein